MTFSTVWGFGSVTNDFVYFNGPQIIFSWIFMFVLYFIPYALMVGELGSAFKNEGGGVSSWLHQTTNAKLAYYAGWTYWACHITYIASKGSGFLKALSWAIFRNAESYDSVPTLYIQLATFCILLLGCYIASLGLNPLKKLLTAAGTCTFVVSLLYIVMMFAVPVINSKGRVMIHLSTQHKLCVLQRLIVEQPVQFRPLYRGVSVFVLDGDAVNSKGVVPSANRASTRLVSML